MKVIQDWARDQWLESTRKRRGLKAVVEPQCSRSSCNKTCGLDSGKTPTSSLCTKKGSRPEAKNYRPVSLLSVASKVLEGIITARLISHLDSQHFLSPRQFGFRKGRTYADDITIVLAQRQTPPDRRLETEMAGKLASLWRISWLLDVRGGRELLYKNKAHSSLEHSCLA
ncbi:uncharacterized protein LOC135097630 [Scylla paramamosain]|uniref:uncharacterized protein LOC135097630 n=1 Tax=Scylla paramamosain TaxID=85552 RepID=UPI0030836ECA